MSFHVATRLPREHETLHRLTWRECSHLFVENARLTKTSLRTTNVLRPYRLLRLVASCPMREHTLTIRRHQRTSNAAMSESYDSSASSSATSVSLEAARIEVRNTPSRASFLTKILVGVFLGVAFLVAAFTLAVWYYKSLAQKRAEAIEMGKMEEAARAPEVERLGILEHRASTLATLEGWNGERVVTERGIAR